MFHVEQKYFSFSIDNRMRLCYHIVKGNKHPENTLQEVHKMKVKFPQYKVTLVVRVNGTMQIHEYRTTVLRSVVNAKKFFADADKWAPEWEDVKVVSVDRDGVQEFDVPTVDLYNMVYDYTMNKEENNNEHCE